MSGKKTRHDRVNSISAAVSVPICSFEAGVQYPDKLFAYQTLYVSILTCGWSQVVGSDQKIKANRPSLSVGVPAQQFL